MQPRGLGSRAVIAMEKMKRQNGLLKLSLFV